MSTRCRTCGHTRDLHSHYRKGTDCSRCDCTRWRPLRWLAAVFGGGR